MLWCANSQKLLGENFPKSWGGSDFVPFISHFPIKIPKVDFERKHKNNILDILGEEEKYRLQMTPIPLVVTPLSKKLGRGNKK